MGQTIDKRITAYACGMCGNIFLIKNAAALCCKCSKCEMKFKKTSSWNSVCGHCLKSAKSQLAKILSSKRQKKGSSE
jgi:protein-arginine kinase activator protein McsA